MQLPRLASLIGHLGSSTFRLSTTTTVSMSLTGSCFSSESALGPFHHGIRERGGTIFWIAVRDQRSATPLICVARQFVFAMGAVENARNLLILDRKNSDRFSAIRG